MTRTTQITATILATALFGVVALAAQPAGWPTRRPPAADRAELEALEARVRALETRVSILERRLREPGRDRPIVTGDLEDLPRRVVNAIAWAHPRADVTDADLRDGVWEIELDEPPNEWFMRITPEGRIIEDRVDD